MALQPVIQNASGGDIISATQTITLPLPLQIATAFVNPRHATATQLLPPIIQDAEGSVLDIPVVTVGNAYVWPDVVPNPGSDLSAGWNPTGLEKAMADVEGMRLIGLQAEWVKLTWDPYSCPIELLPYLAWAMGVTFWNDGWSDVTKRAWVAYQWWFKQQRGTVDGMSFIIDFAGRDVTPFGYQLNSVIHQPQKIFPGPSVSAAARLAWLETLPQLRVYYYRGSGTVGPVKAFCGPSWSILNRNPEFITTGKACIPSTAPSQLSRVATWYDANGVATDQPVVDDGSFYQVHRYGKVGSKRFCNMVNNPSTTMGKFLQPSDAWKRIYTIEPQNTSLNSFAVGPSLVSIQAQPTLIAQPGQRGFGAYCGSKYVHGTGDFLGDGKTILPTNRFFIPSTSKYRLYDAYFVYDPDDLPPGVPASMISAFTGMKHIGWPKYTVQANVFMAGKRSPLAASSEGFLTPKSRFFIPHDPKPMQYVSSALEASRRMSDKILLKSGPWPTFVAGSMLIAGHTNFIVGKPQQTKPAQTLTP